MPDPKRPDLSAIPRLTEPLENDELTAHFAVPRELLDQLRDEDDARSDRVHTAPTLPPPAPAAAQAESPRPAAPPVARVVFPPTSDAELHAQVSAMLRPQRVARGLSVALLALVAGVVLGWRLLSP